MGVTFVVKCLEMLLGRIGFAFDLEIFNYYRRFSIQLYLGLLLSRVLILFYLVTDRDWVLVGAGWLTWLEILVEVVDVCLTEAFLAGSA
jgi:F0F1-type ATP synthase membrane subunit a